MDGLKPTSYALFSAEFRDKEQWHEWQFIVEAENGDHRQFNLWRMATIVAASSAHDNGYLLLGLEMQDSDIAIMDNREIQRVLDSERD